METVFEFQRVVLTMITMRNVSNIITSILLDKCKEILFKEE